MPRLFTPSQLYSTTNADLQAMSQADQAAFYQQLLALWAIQTAETDACYLAADYDLVASNRRYEWGE
jgi:hypothetical protein